MGYKKNRKRSNGRRSKLHTVRQRRRTSKNHSCLSSCVHRCVGGEALRKIQMMKALDFGIQSGYLVPTDKTYRILHVSSDLLRKQKRKSRTSLTRNYKRIGSDENSWNLHEEEKNEVEKKNRMSPKFEEYPVQEARRRRSRSRRGRSRRRSRSRSRNKRRRSSRRRSRRRRSRRRRSSNNPENMEEDEDDYEQDENTTNKNPCNKHTTNSNDSRNSRSKSPDVDKTNIEKSPDDISDVSLDDDDESEEDEEDKKKTNAS